MSDSGNKTESAQPLPNTPRGPLDVTSECWMVGHRNPQSLLQCNTYVRRFVQGGKKVNVCIDPGSQFDFSVIEDNVSRLVGDLGEINAITVNHQDPDVAGNTPQFCDANPRSELIVTEEVWRLLQHQLLKPGQLRLANATRSSRVAIGPQHEFQLVPTPFCHFRGAMAFYDPEIRTLFSGDLFGGLNRVGGVHLMATEDDWLGIAQFHQIYMPAREVLRYAVRQILSIKPAVEIIAPQHGHVITGELVGVFLERMHELLVGHDLLSDEWDADNLDGYREVLQRLFECAENELGRIEVACRIKSQDVDDDLDAHLRFTDGDVKLDREGYAAVAKTFSRLTHQESDAFVTEMRDVVLSACSELNLPIPPVGAGLQEATTGN